VLSRQNVIDIKEKHNLISIITNHTKDLEFDYVIVGIGINPAIDLAQSIGLKIENGILVDNYCQTSISDIYAAGDVANFDCIPLQKRLRFEHEDNATRMGLCAGKNMAGNVDPYNYLPYFYSDLFDIAYEAVGEINAQMDTYIDWVEEFQEGAVYYLEGNRIHGILLWNMWDYQEIARILIKEKKITDKAELKGLIQSFQPEITQ
jgi:NADPH-dependent 2,4-dienoyl-CoA reductase/sulfur reductase-like enzyme